jgi:hypothetical protein
MAGPERFASCWIGPRLNPLGHLCISSFLAHGFGFDLHTFEPTEDVPEAAAIHDATAILPRDRVFVAHGGLETATEQWAYRYLLAHGGWVVDLDVLCNANVVPAAPIAFAEEKPGIINNAVLRFPPDHPAIVELLDYCATIDPVTAPWGSTGPLALTEVFGRHAELMPYRLPRADVYPIHWRETPKLLFPEFADEIQARVARSPFIHLWGSTLRELGLGNDDRPPRGSFLDQVYAQYMDPALLDRLQAADEAALRTEIPRYIERNWPKP